jgi:hypothetical protein
MIEAKVAGKARAAAKAAPVIGRSRNRGESSKPENVGAHGKSTAASPTAKAKHKVVRDSFTIPKAEYEILAGLKDRAVHLRRPAKKSELLRAGVATLQAMTDKAFLSALNGVTSLKTGRPKGAARAKAKPPEKA